MSFQNLAVRVMQFYFLNLFMAETLYHYTTCPWFCLVCLTLFFEKKIKRVTPEVCKFTSVVMRWPCLKSNF